MANVLILSLVFPPDSVSTAQIMGELGTDLESQGHKVTVITTFPHYNRDSEAESMQPIRNYWGPVLRKSDYQGIPVYHTFMPKKGKNVILRLLAWGGFHQISVVAGMTTVPRPDVILRSTGIRLGGGRWVRRVVPMLSNIIPACRYRTLPRIDPDSGVWGKVKEKDEWADAGES